MGECTHLIRDLGPECTADISGLAVVINDQPPKLVRIIGSLGHVARAGIKVVEGHRPAVAGRRGRSVTMCATRCHTFCPLVPRPRAGRVEIGSGVCGGGLGGIAAAGVVPRGLDLDLAAQLLDNPLQLPQPLHQLDLALAGRLLGWCIGVLWSRAARCAARSGKDAWDLGSPAIRTWHVLVTAYFSPPAGDTAARVQTVGGRSCRGIDLGAWEGRVRVRLWGCGVVVECAIVVW